MFDDMPFLGVQYYITQYLAGVVVTQEDIDEAAKLCEKHFGATIFNRAGWQHILQDHGGKLPVEIKAIPEGSVVEGHNALMTIRNTCPKCFWVTNWLETLMLKVWYPTTVGALSREIRKVVQQYLADTSDGDLSFAAFMLQDFGQRGVSSEESAALGGYAHLVNFQGSDTLRAIEMTNRIYSADMAGYSVAASEHSTMTSWTKANEINAVENMLDSYPSGIVSIVGDSYDIYNFVGELLGKKLRLKVLGRDGKTVVRPDSGEPREVVLKVLELLGERFGYSINSKGYKVLCPKVGVIQGDGMNFHSIVDLYAHLKAKGWSAENLVVGMGGGLLQQVNRDTLKMAFKCSNVVVNGADRVVYKDPITDPGKVSKRGRLAVIQGNHGFHTIELQPGLGASFDRLETVFLDGEVKKTYTLAEIRERAIVSNSKSYKAL